jgi:hypothetical protein
MQAFANFTKYQFIALVTLLVGLCALPLIA